MTVRSSTTSSDLKIDPQLTRIAHFPRLRALAWAGDILYASHGYELLRSRIDGPLNLRWQSAGAFRPSFRRRLSVRNRLTTRLSRDGFHALAVLPSALVAAVPGAIVTLRANEPEFRITHAIARGTRPLHITAVPDGAILWGEYFDNPSREEVHIYASTDRGETWTVAYTFPAKSIRHVHNIVHDAWANCLWIFTGDYGDECRILRASCDLSRVETVMQGNQQVRAVAAVPTTDALYFSSDTPLEQNYIYRLDRSGVLTQLAPISSSSIYGCRTADNVFFSTMVEPSEVNRDRSVRIYIGKDEHEWRAMLEWRKDSWPMGLFQYGNAFLPDGVNKTRFLAVSTIAVAGDDQSTSLYEVKL